MVTSPPLATHDYTAIARYLILGAAFLGWAASGFQMAVMTLTARAATTDFLRAGQLSGDEPLRFRRLFSFQRSATDAPSGGDSSAAFQAIAPLWFSWYNAAFLFGAAAGGLVFAGDQSGWFRALDSSSGKVLWQVNLGSPVTGYPIAYSVNGRQYVAVSGGGGLGGARGAVAAVANNLFVFALPN